MLTVFLATALITFIGCLYLYYKILISPDQASWLGWAVLGGSLVAAVALGLLMTKFARIGAVFLAAWGGFMLGMLVNETVLIDILPQSYYFWICCAAGASACAFTVFVWYNHAVIWSSSLVGSYLIVRGVSLYLGGFPDEFLLMKEIRSGFTVSEPTSFYFYVGGIIVGTILSALWQYRTLSRMDEYKKHPYERLK